MMDQQFQDALALIGLKELENSYLRKQVNQLQLALRQLSQQLEGAGKPEQPKNPV